MSNTRIIEVKDTYGADKKIKLWEFEYNPEVTAEELKNITSCCKIAKYPDSEYSFRITHNDKKYNYWSDGDDLIFIMAQMCILLGDKELNILLEAQKEDWIQNDKDFLEV